MSKQPRNIKADKSCVPSFADQEQFCREAGLVTCRAVSGPYSFLSLRRVRLSAVHSAGQHGALTEPGDYEENITQLQSCPRSLVGHHNTFEGIQPVDCELIFESRKPAQILSSPQLSVSLFVNSYHRLIAFKIFLFDFHETFSVCQNCKMCRDKCKPVDNYNFAMILHLGVT